MRKIKRSKFHYMFHRNSICLSVLSKNFVAKKGGFIRACMRKIGDMIRGQVRILYLLFL